MRREFSPGMQQILTEVTRSYPLLSAEQERNLIQAFQNSSQTAGDTLIYSNVRLIAQQALKNSIDHVHPDDKFQYGTLGFRRAIEKFDVGRGYRLSTYATWWVRQAIDRFSKEEHGTIYIPPGVQLQAQQIDIRRSQIIQELQREPTLAEVASLTNNPPDLVDSLNQVSVPVASLNAPLRNLSSNGPAQYPENLPDPSVNVEAEATTNGFLRQDIAAVLVAAPLTEVQRVALIESFGLRDGQPRNRLEVAKLLSERLPNARQRSKNGKREAELNPQTVGHIIKTAILKIRETPGALALLSAYRED